MSGRLSPEMSEKLLGIRWYKACIRMSPMRRSTAMLADSLILVTLSQF